MLKRTNPIQDYVRQYAPSQYAEIRNPETFFPQMLNELQEAEDAALVSMQGETWRPSDEDRANPLKMLGEYRARTNAASELAWQQVVLDRFPPEVDETGEPLAQEIHPLEPEDESLLD